MLKKLLLIVLFCTNLTLFAQSPVLSNFRVDETNKNRIYFESDKSITASNTNGFIISGKTISGITINADLTTEHYFTVSSEFSFWDNNTIRYEGGGDIKDVNDNGLRDFTLTYIKNNIPEPESSINRFVTNVATGGGDGLTEGTAWTWAEAVRYASSGQTVWVKAGLYNFSQGQHNLSNSGDISSPIKFIGYKNDIGDITSNYYSFNEGMTSPLLESSEMPTFDGNLINKVYPIVATDKNYVIFKNFQMTEIQYPMRVSSGLGWVVENCNIMEPNDSDGAGTGFHFYPKVYNAGVPELTSYRFKNVTVINSEMSNIWINGRGNLIDNGKAYSDTRGGTIHQSDYLITVQGNDNIIMNSFASTLDGSGSLVHGIGIKGNESFGSGSTGKITEYNLIDNCVYTGSGEGFYVRNEAHYNVIKNSTATGGFEGISIRTGASYNIFENLKIKNQTNGVGGRHNREIGSAVNITTQNNIIRNSTFSNIKYMISFHMSNVILNNSNTISLLNNKFQNCTFSNIDYMNRGENQSKLWNLSGNTIQNCILNNISNENYSTRIPLLQTMFEVIDHNNYWNSFTTNLGSNSTSVDPQLDVDFKLTPSTPSSISDGGVDIPGLNYDLDGIERQSGKYSKGAYEDEVLKVGSVSPDVSICIGENTVLTALGGTSYNWNTGETTASITVNPTSTVIYTVTISDGNSSDSHDVTVTVDEAPSVDLGADQSICYGDTITLIATGIGNFLWSTGETTASITVNPTTTMTYSVTASNSCATDATDEIIINVNPEIGLTVGTDVSICILESTTLTATGNGDFLWSTGETTPSITVQPNSTTTYTVTSTLGTCTETEDVIVTVNEAPSVDLGADQSICFGESVTLTATGVGFFLWSTGETTSSITVNPTATMTYSVTASNDCATDATDDIIINVNPEIGLVVGNDINICIGESTTLTATGNGDFLWNTGETTPSITVQPNSTTTYTVTSTLGTCTETEDVVVTVNEAPSVNLGADQSICFGESVTLTATGIGNFLWNTGETTASILVNPTMTTTYSVTASTGCATDATDDIIINVNPEIGLTVGSDISICAGESATLTATGNGDFLWSTGETTPSITVQPNSTTTYSVTSTLGTCTENEIVLVTVSEVPSVDLGPDLSICYNETETVTLIATGTGNFLWSTGETTSSITVDATTTTTYSVTASNGCATDATDDIIINVNQEIDLTLGSSEISICAGESTTLTATGNGDFLWNTGETTSSITVQPNGTTRYTVTSTLGTCTENESVLVTVSEAPSVDLGADQTICFGESVTLTAAGAGNFIWSTGETTSSITVNPTTTTAYSVTISNACKDGISDTIIVNVNPEIDLEVGSDISICAGESATLTATGNGDFLWSTGETTQSITVSPNSTETYTVIATLDNCSKTDEIIVAVNQLASVNAGSDVTICVGESTTLTATGIGDFLWSTGETTASISVNPTTTTTYSVTASTGCATDATDDIIININPEIDLALGSSNESICAGESTTLTATGNGDFLWNTGETTPSITVQPNSTTTYTVTSTLGTCTETEDVVVTVNEAPSVNLGADQSICYGESITLTATGTGNFLWNTGETTSSIIVSPTTTTTYTVTASNSCAIEASDELVVNVNKIPVAAANDDMTILAGTSVDLTVSGDGFFEWSTGEVGTRISVSPTVTTTYTVTATTGEGCSVYDEVVITVVDEYVPTVITITVGQDVTICSGDTVILEAPSGTSYLWSSGETGSSISVSPSETTIYSVKVYNGEDSETSHSTITVTEDCSEAISETTVSDFDLDQDMTVYPNPTKGLLNVKLKGYNNDSKVSVYNLNGAMLYTRIIDNKSRASVLREQLDLSRFPKGVYLVQLNNNGKSKTKKVIVM